MIKIRRTKKNVSLNTIKSEYKTLNGRITKWQAYKSVEEKERQFRSNEENTKITRLLEQTTKYEKKKRNKMFCS